ncbi:SHOCT domain-containing protein [Pseudonocardia bannensis]|uniref:SHOCT domain-containing protein n=1 Tax=Pseudonocardia bannensis TaxID=630973 RepID=A0A848DEZ7_9PSEU|nr:SHOCT domain-containing protein [Pseudonocardia bannensis]NMH91218.1 SHOCT domain-containing protein [Pseudonocardia bannensis]
MMFWWGNHMGGWGSMLMAISTIVVWLVVIAGIVALARYTAQQRQEYAAPPPPRPTPEQLLAERFARGDIDEPEYRHRLDTLTTTVRTPADRS